MRWRLAPCETREESEESDEYARTKKRRIDGAHCGIGEASRSEEEGKPRVQGGRKRRRQRVWTGTISGDTVLRTVDPAAGRGRRAAGVPGRKQEQTENERR